MRTRLRSFVFACTALLLTLGFSGFCEVVEAQILLDGGSKDSDPKKERRRTRRARRAKAAKCEDGRVNVDKECCWPGQTVDDGECAGVPTSCPEGRRLDTAQQACVLAACEDGMVRMSDDVHCCWAGQTWNSRKDLCVGDPECPAGFVASAGGCDGDADRDNVFGAMDLCPEEAEDADRFDDSDGCPDYDNDKDGVCDPWVRELGVSVMSCVGSDLCPDVSGPDQGCPATGSGFAQSGLPPSDPVDDGSGPAWWSWVVAGGGLAVAGGGVALHFMAEGKRDEVRSAISGAGESPVTSLTRQEALDLQDEANTLDTTGVIVMGAGGALFVTGAVLVIATWGDSDTAGVSGVILPSGDALVTVSGRF